MATGRSSDLIEAMISPRAQRRPHAGAEHLIEQTEQIAVEHIRERSAERIIVGRPSLETGLEGRLEVRPIGTPLGLRELATLHKRTWSTLNVREKRVHMMMWPLALHFGIYEIKPGQERRRPPLIAAFWARCLAEAPLSLGHLYPAALFKNLDATEIYEFGGMVVDPQFQGRGLMRLMTDTARLFVFSVRPKLLITNPVEPLYELYKQIGMKTIGKEPIQHPHINVKVWLMYGRFEDLSKPYFM
jgi:GNAT superfamily N-acetyltransferase